MSSLRTGRFAAQIEGDFVVFVIGMRINHLFAIHRWLPVAQAMGRMLPELSVRPELGLLSFETLVGWRTVVTIQYWRSFELLHAYAHARNLQHLPAWAAFNRAAKGNTSVGIFHETYAVRAGAYEAIYADMPPFGLGRAGSLAPAVGRLHDAAQRMNAAGTSNVPGTKVVTGPDNTAGIE